MALRDCQTAQPGLRGLRSPCGAWCCPQAGPLRVEDATPVSSCQETQAWAELVGSPLSPRALSPRPPLGPAGSV